MPDQLLFSRRDFLKNAAYISTAAILNACSSKGFMNVETETLPTSLPAKNSIDKVVAIVTPTKKIVEAIQPEMVLVEAGNFMMGSKNGYPNEQPVHDVEITRPFFIGKFAVTFQEYDLFCEDTGLSKPDDRGWGRQKNPVISVDFIKATAYCNWLSAKEGLSACYSGKGKNMLCDFSADGYRLPSEAEWEYAAHGGQKCLGYTYSGSNTPTEVAWFDANANGQIHPVGQKLPNELGLFDMSGNLYEWCWDWYDKDYYQDSPDKDPWGPPPPQAATPWEQTRVRRSGSWRENSDSIRITFRSYDAINYPGDNGFRLVRSA